MPLGGQAQTAKSVAAHFPATAFKIQPSSCIDTLYVGEGCVVSSVTEALYFEILAPNIVS